MTPHPSAPPSSSLPAAGLSELPPRLVISQPPPPPPSPASRSYQSILSSHFLLLVLFPHNTNVWSHLAGLSSSSLSTVCREMVLIISRYVALNDANHKGILYYVLYFYLNGSQKEKKSCNHECRNRRYRRWMDGGSNGGMNGLT